MMHQCFVAGREENDVMVGEYLVKVRAYRIRSKYGDKVGSCFPELLAKVPGRGSGNQACPQSWGGPTRISILLGPFVASARSATFCARSCGRMRKALLGVQATRLHTKLWLDRAAPGPMCNLPT